MLSFWAWRSLKPFQTRGALGTREPWFPLDDVEWTWGARGAGKTFRSREALVSLVAFDSLQAGGAFLTVKPWNSWGSHISLSSCDSWRAANARHALESWVSLGPWSSRSARPAWVPLVTFQPIEPGEAWRPHGSRMPWQAGLSLRAAVSFGPLYRVAWGPWQSRLSLWSRGTHESLFSFGSRNSWAPG